MSELTTLAQAIRAEDEACHFAASEALNHAIKAGEYLSAAKKLIPHGGWEKWLDSEKPVDSIRTAQVYVQLFQNRKAIEKAQRAAPLSIREAFKLIADDRNEELAAATARIHELGGKAAIESFIVTMLAFEQVRDQRFWRESHSSFDAYCQKAGSDETQIGKFIELAHEMIGDKIAA